MTAVEPKKLFTTISFKLNTEVVPENDFHRSCEIFMTVCDNYGTFIRQIVRELFCYNKVENIYSFQLCTHFKKLCR